MIVNKDTWQRTELKHLLKEYSVKNKTLSCNKVFSVTNSEGFIASDEYFDTTVFSNNLSTYKRVERGMFAYNPSRINVGSIALLEKEDTVVVSPLYVIFSCSERIAPHYLLRFLKSNVGLALIQSKTSGSVRNSLRFKDLTSLQITLPPLEQQRLIVDELNAIQKIIDGYKQQISDLELLAQSIFLCTFGDVSKNDKNWDIIPMGNLGNFKNGLNYDKNEKGKVLKFIGVGDFQNNKYLSSSDILSTIEVESITEEYLLKDEDIVFVRSNGNKNLVGRCLEVFPNGTEITYSGFCIRFRKTTNIINKYLLGVLTNATFKKTHVLKSNGIGIQNINQKLLSNLPIPIPPIELQKKYENLVDSIYTQKKLIWEQLRDAEQLMAERMQYYFS